MTYLAIKGDVSPGILGFTIVAALGVTLFFLIKSMNRQISRIEAPREEDLKQAEWERHQADAGPKSEDGSAGDTDPKR